MEKERDLVFSENVRAGKRIYYFDVKQTRNGDRYISITESKKVVDGPVENPRMSFEKHKLFLYKEDYEKFLSAFLKVLDVARSGAPAPAWEAVSEEMPSGELHVGVKEPVAEADVQENVDEEASNVVFDIQF